MDLRDIKEFFRDCFGYIVLLVIIILIFTFVVAFHPVAGNSMVPTLEEGDITLVSKFHKHLFKIKRNQIIIIKKEHKSYIKRIVGLPKEHIKYFDNILYVDNKKIDEKFLDKNVHTNNFKLEDICDIEICKNGVIPDDYYLVLGDNRVNSVDSRDKNFSLVHKSEIQGVALFKIWPVNNIRKI